MNETKLSIGIAFYALRQFYDNILLDVIINTGCPKHRIRLCLWFQSELYSLQSTANWGPNKQFPAQNVIELLFSRLALTSKNSIYLLMKKVPYLG